VTQATGVNKRVTTFVNKKKKVAHFFSVDRDGAIQICSEGSGSLSCFPFMSAGEKLFVGGRPNFSKGNYYRDLFAYTICGKAIVRLGAIESIPMRRKTPILVSKNRILLEENNKLSLVVF
jgi:hypothetical protein